MICGSAGLDEMASTNVTAVIMAGGKSSRMGMDKSFVLVHGRPMIEHIIERVTGLGDELIIITNQAERYAYLGLPLFSDIRPGQGPLGGLYTALHYARSSHVLVVACDMPWLNRPLLEFMLSLRESAEAIVPRWEKHPEPLHAVYSQTCREAIQRNLAAGQLKVANFYDQVKVRYLDRETITRFDPLGRSFANVNTPEELAAATLSPNPSP